MSEMIRVDAASILIGGLRFMGYVRPDGKVMYETTTFDDSDLTRACLIAMRELCEKHLRGIEPGEWYTCAMVDPAALPFARMVVEMLSDDKGSECPRRLRTTRPLLLTTEGSEMEETMGNIETSVDAEGVRHVGSGAIGFRTVLAIPADDSDYAAIKANISAGDEYVIHGDDAASIIGTIEALLRRRLHEPQRMQITRVVTGDGGE